MASSKDSDRITFRTLVLASHLHRPDSIPPPSLQPSACLNYSPPELSEVFEFDTAEMRRLMDGHNLEDRDWLFGLMAQSWLFGHRERGGRVFVSPDYNQSAEEQREMTVKRVGYLLECGVFEGWLTEEGPQAELRRLALYQQCFQVHRRGETENAAFGGGRGSKGS